MYKNIIALLLFGALIFAASFYVGKEKTEMDAVIQMATYYADGQYEKAADYADAIDPVGKQEKYWVLLGHVRKAYALMLFERAQLKFKEQGARSSAVNDFAVAKFYAEASRYPDAFPEWAKKLGKEIDFSRKH